MWKSKFYGAFVLNHRAPDSLVDFHTGEYRRESGRPTNSPDASVDPLDALAADALAAAVLDDDLDDVDDI